jgi:hypothetical protein
MKIPINEILSLGMLINNLVARLEEILPKDKSIKIIIYYEDSCAFIASNIIRMIDEMSHRNYNLIYMIQNIDADTRPLEVRNELGNNFYTIAILEDVSNEEILHRFLNSFKIDPRFKHIYLSTQIATDQQIETFFKSIWHRWILNAALIFWNGTIQIYTHFPYEGKFLFKAYSEPEINKSGLVKLPSNLFNILFANKNDDLHGTTFLIYLIPDIPKIFEVPGRFRIGPKYYFYGRDGITSNVIEQKLNATWKYQKIPTRHHIVRFRFINSSSSITPTDARGNIVPPDDATPLNVDYLPFKPTTFVS